MAIVKMKKLQLMALRLQRDALLKKLMLLGCVELREPEDLLHDHEAASLLTRDTSNLTEYRAKRAALAEGIRLSDQYAPKKKPLLSPLPSVSEAEFLDESKLDGAVAIAREISSLDERIRSDRSEQARRLTIAETLRPWTQYHVPLEITGTASVSILLGTVPVQIDFDALNAALLSAVPESEIYTVSTDENLRYLNIFTLKSGRDNALKALREFGFAFPAFGNLTGTAEECIKSEEAAAKASEVDAESCTAKLCSESENRDLLKISYDYFGTLVERAEAAEHLLKTETVFILEGWFSAPQEQELLDSLKQFCCTWNITEPDEEEYPDVPVLLKNNKFTNALNMVTNMYSLPAYGTVDPNPLMAPFFILFYGIMMADMGYGFLMIIAAIVAMKKMRPRGGTQVFCQLLLYGGISTFIMGALTGGFFSDAPLQIVKMFNPDTTWEGLPALFNPLNDSIYVLVGALVLGVIHLNTGLVVSFVRKVKSGQLIDGILYECSLWVILLGIILAVLGVGGKLGIAVLIVGCAALLWGSMRTAKGFGKFTAIFSTLYNELTGWFGDILSYSRIMALMLAGSVIGQVFNTIASLFGNIFVFIIIFLIGHALNFGLNLLGCYVHDLRLQCLEFFGKFYTDGGRAFNPLKINTKYVDVTK